MFFTITLPPSYEGRSHSGNFIDEFLLRIGGVPGVLTSAAVHSRPIDGAMPVSMGIRVAPRDARDVTASQATPLVGFRIVTEDYFRALGLPLLRGRSFTERDEFGPTPIGVDPDFPWRVIISERLAEMLFADDDPTGRQVSLWVGEMDTPAVLIGVVGNVRERGLDSDPTLAVYLPFKGTNDPKRSRRPHTWRRRSLSHPGSPTPSYPVPVISFDKRSPPHASEAGPSPRSTRRPISARCLVRWGGPVAVYGPNNFPLAFNGVAGGDFAAAIAAGNPVIAKAHPSHPRTSQLLAEEAFAAVQEVGLPAATVQTIYRTDHKDGTYLVSHPLIGATGYTGSRWVALTLKAAADAPGTCRAP